MGQDTLDLIWILVATGLVFLMQCGFLLLESGLTRSKHSINVALKNLTDFGISVLLFWLFGYGIMFGVSSAGWLGADRFAVELGADDPKGTAFFLFQAMFCGTATTIVSGAVAERMRFNAYLVVAVLLSGLVYTGYGHWAWNGLDAAQAKGWLASRGFVDFAGSTVVHSVGGWVALAAVLVLGPRSGRFDSSGKPRKISASNLPLALAGALLLWLGWFGFNGGSVLAMNASVGSIIAKTTLAGAAGMVVTLVISGVRQGSPNVPAAINGALGGLVAVTAPVHAVGAGAAVAIGAIGGAVVLLVEALLLRWRIDDVVGAVPVHAGAGVWGTVAVAVFGDLEVLGTGLSRGEQLVEQLIGVVVAFLWAFLLPLLVLGGLNRVLPLRVLEDAERVGLNVAEHQESTELLQLFEAMDEQAQSGDVSRRVPADPFTDVGIIAAHYNHVLDALEGAMARTRGIVRTAMDGIVTFGNDLVIQRANPATESIFGYDAGELSGLKLETLVASGDTAELSDTPLEELEEGSGQLLEPVESRGRRKSGKEFPMEISIVRVRAGDDHFFTATLRDITERKAAEEALIAARDAANAANMAKSQFLATMSHELRTPLNAIIGYSEMLMEDAEEEGREAMVDDLDRILTSGKHLLAVINDILDFSKIEAGRITLEAKGFELSRVLEQVADSVKPLVSKNGNELSIDLAPDLGTVLGDETRVRQCLLNLLSNASKFTNDGSVTLRARREAVAGVHWISCAVEDTGIGMTPQQMERLFQPFSQADSSTVRKYGGTGLGLAISQRFTQLMGGDIRVTSEAGAGSTFTMRFPADARRA